MSENSSLSFFKSFLSRYKKTLSTPPSLSRRDVYLTFFPAIAWGLAIQSRKHLIDLRCLKNPGNCDPTTVFSWDQIALSMESGTADRLSFFTQDFSGYLALGIPLFWSLRLLKKKELTERQFRSVLLADWILLLQASLWNGFIKESTNLITQRARPFVYADPLILGGSHAHYTSFYSGHTSFSAAAGATLIFTLLGRNASRPWILSASLLALTLAVSTGVLRVLAGRHYPSDVIVGFFMGILVSFFVARLHRESHSTPSL